jgi:hypothetical protein
MSIALFSCLGVETAAVAAANVRDPMPLSCPVLRDPA